ncbi:hypothetical protein [Spirulina sp. 06S082]|uniref:hypothetical protein n=1 Tax=Spirulina sp. 06S082 TaxID=3110248 RepID=UPI002B204E9C|nr:hypothetical protein [Spirulina sp. 06S082]MEA5467652.1 hypothetical protein [Spirulina sp. 06S082]
MKDFDSQQMLDEVFQRVRQDFQIGTSEYLAALQALRGGWGNNEEDLREMLQLLWCHSLSQQDHFLGFWDASKVSLAEKKTESDRDRQQQSVSPASTDLSPKSDAIANTITHEIGPLKQQTAYRFAPVPTRAPLTAMDSEMPAVFPTDFPLSRRAMIYHWQYINRPVKDGSEDVLDVSETVERAARQGFFLSPAYTRQETNHAHLLLLIDRNGSMTPFHPLTRELVKTARWESSLAKLDIFYFHNVPATSIYRDPYLMESVLLAEVLKMCDRNTSVLVVSDGGAARGYRSLARVQATTEFLLDMGEKTSYIAWLNPIPKNRWYRTSAQFIADRVPMFPMDNQGLSHAIDTIMGKKLSQYR